MISTVVYGRKDKISFLDIDNITIVFLYNELKIERRMLMCEKISKEHIVQVIERVMQDPSFDIITQFEDAMNKIEADKQSNPICREILAASIAQSNSLLIMREVLYELLNE